MGFEIMYHKQRSRTLDKSLRRHSDEDLMCGMKSNPRNTYFFQDKRHEINEEIFKQLRIRAGAENMLTALSDCKDKHASKVIEMELNFVESNIQLLRDQLSKMNTPTQFKNSPGCIPMVAIGLKETRTINLRMTIMDFIMEHYGEDPQDYENLVERFLLMRRSTQDVFVDETGINSLLDYYNQLYYMEHRFFPADRNMGIFFEWYDSISGDPSAELSISFEKGSILYNVGALWSQIAVTQDLCTASGCQIAAKAFQCAAGCFDFLKSNYDGSPSTDLKPETMDFLMTLMLAQSQECYFEMLSITKVSTMLPLDSFAMKSAETSEIAESYDVCTACLKCDDMWSYIPQSWRSLAMLKASHYRSLSHYYVAKCITDVPDSKVGDLEKHLSQLYVINSENGTTAEICALLVSLWGRRRLASLHLNSDIKHRSEAMRTQRGCTMLRKLDFLYKIMENCEMNSKTLLEQCQQEIHNLPDMAVPYIRGRSIEKAFCSPPDFTSIDTKDIFYQLGPISVFSAQSTWASPRTVMLRNDGDGLGFDVYGSMPVTVLKITENSPAETAGLLPKDYIVGIGDRDIRWLKHSEAVRCIRDAGDNIELRVITPLSTVHVPISHLQAKQERRRMTSMFMETLAISPTSSIIQNKSKHNNTNSGKSNNNNKQRISTISYLSDNNSTGMMRF